MQVKTVICLRFTVGRCKGKILEYAVKFRNKGRGNEKKEEENVNNKK
jgi:hypothetical protein